MSGNYTADFNLWIEQTAQLLRSHHWHEVDVEHLVEEVEGLGKSERRGIASQLIRLLLHLLKWQYQPQRRPDSWLDSITDSRTQIELAIEDSPSLKSYSTKQLQESYQRARRQAAKQTGILISVFPEECPYSVELVLDEDWLPLVNCGYLDLEKSKKNNPSLYQKIFMQEFFCISPLHQ